MVLFVMIFEKIVFIMDLSSEDLNHVLNIFYYNGCKYLSQNSHSKITWVTLIRIMWLKFLDDCNRSGLISIEFDELNLSTFVRENILFWFNLCLDFVFPLADIFSSIEFGSWLALSNA